MPSAEDYGWVDDSPLGDGFSLTWVKDVAPDDVVRRLDGRTIRQVDWNTLTSGDIGEGLPGHAFWLAITTAGTWSMFMDLTYSFGISDDALLPLSRGTTVISHFQNVELDDQYYLVRDGDVRLDFQPWDPTDRRGSAPDELVDVMAQVGFDLTPQDFDPSDPDYVERYPTEAALALTEHLTEVPLSMGLLESASYLLAIVDH